MFDRLLAWQTSFAPQFSLEKPLGPIDLGRLNQPDLAAFLTNFENESFQSLTERTSVFLGRRGAGKSSVIKAFEAAEELRRFSMLSSNRSANLFSEERPNDLSRAYAAKISLKTHDEQSRIMEQCSLVGFATIEHYVEAWTRRIWHHIILRCAKLNGEVRRIPAEMAELCKLYEKQIKGRTQESELASRDTLEKIETLDGRDDFVAFASALQRAKINFLVLSDSMEEYDVGRQDLCMTVAGLVRLAADDSPLSSVAVFKVALPLEIYDRVKPHASEDKIDPYKTYLRWTSGDLIRILAFRFLCYVRANDKGAFDKLKEQLHGSDERRIGLTILDDVLGGHLINEAGHSERAITLLLRHTQLLPRQSIIHLAKIVKIGGSMGPHPSQPAIMSALNDTARSIASHILESHKFRYPEIAEKASRVAQTMPATSISVSDFHSQVYNKSSFRRGQDFSGFVDDLIRVGVVGKVTDPSDMRYIKASFYYANPESPSWTEKDYLALHPLFSRRFRSDRIDLDKPVMPSGTTENWD